MSSKGARPTHVQMQMLLDILDKTNAIKNGQIQYAVHSRMEFWKRVANKLNTCEGGIYKTPLKWCKMWADWKCKTKYKGCCIIKKKNELSEPRPRLSKLEYSLLKMIDFPVQKIKDDVVDMSPDNIKFLRVKPNVHILQDVGEMDSEVQEVTFQELKNEIEYSSSEISVEPEEVFEESVPTTRVEEVYTEPVPRRRVKEVYEEPEPKSIQSTTPIEDTKSDKTDHNLDVRVMLEKERIRQRDEELRLRALELKIRANELQLKEAEINKVNSLMNIEEEKLKCFKDITSMLKELLDRTKNGSTQRFSNIL